MSNASMYELELRKTEALEIIAEKSVQIEENLLDLLSLFGKWSVDGSRNGEAALRVCSVD